MESEYQNIVSSTPKGTLKSRKREFYSKYSKFITRMKSYQVVADIISELGWEYEMATYQKKDIEDQSKKELELRRKNRNERKLKSEEREKKRLETRRMNMKCVSGLNETNSGGENEILRRNEVDSELMIYLSLRKHKDTDSSSDDSDD